MAEVVIRAGRAYRVMQDGRFRLSAARFALSNERRRLGLKTFQFAFESCDYSVVGGQ
jgi:hypothetical protein